MRSTRLGINVIDRINHPIWSLVSRFSLLPSADQRVGVRLGKELYSGIHFDPWRDGCEIVAAGEDFGLPNLRKGGRGMALRAREKRGEVVRAAMMSESGQWRSKGRGGEAARRSEVSAEFDSHKHRERNQLTFRLDNDT